MFIQYSASQSWVGGLRGEGLSRKVRRRRRSREIRRRRRSRKIRRRRISRKVGEEG